MRLSSLHDRFCKTRCSQVFTSRRLNCTKKVGQSPKAMVKSNSIRVHLPVLPNDSFDSGLSHAESARIHGVGVSTSRYASKWCRRGILPAGIYFMRLPDSGSGGEIVVEVPGFEPGQAEPKSVVLPLHHTSVRATKIRIIYAYPQKYLCILIGRGLTGMPPRQLSNEGKCCRGGIPEGLQHGDRSIIR